MTAALATNGLNKSFGSLVVAGDIAFWVRHDLNLDLHLPLLTALRLGAVAIPMLAHVVAVGAPKAAQNAQAAKARIMSRRPETRVLGKLLMADLGVCHDVSVILLHELSAFDLVKCSSLLAPALLALTRFQRGLELCRELRQRRFASATFCSK
jgi:hypothetical protein